MAEDAIQEDVSESEETSTEEENEIYGHESEIERIARKREEFLDSGGEDSDDVEPEQEQQSLPVSERDGEWFTTAKVDGEEVEVPWQDMVAQYQKNASADKRLQEASERQRELEDYERRLNEYRVQLEALQQNQPSSDAGESLSEQTDATDALYSEYHDALFKGDDTTANALLRKIRAAEKPAPQVDVSSIIERTKAEMREEERQARANAYEQRRQDAVKKFTEEFPDIATDSALLAVADAKSAELYSDDPTRDPWEIMQECAEHTRQWLFKYVDDLGGKNDMKARQERKQSTDEVVPRNVRASLGEDMTEPTYSDVIAEMKRDRGQPV